MHAGNQLKKSMPGEGPQGTTSAKNTSAGKRDINLSVGEIHEYTGIHTAGWMTGSKLKVKRNG